MVSEESKLWIKAGIAFGTAIDAKVLCPHCARAHLTAEDIVAEGAKTERRIYCTTCDAENYLLYADGPTDNKHSA